MLGEFIYWDKAKGDLCWLSSDTGTKQRVRTEGSVDAAVKTPVNVFAYGWGCLNPFGFT